MDPFCKHRQQKGRTIISHKITKIMEIAEHFYMSDVVQRSEMD